MQPHRGTLVLVLGILSIVVCQILGPFAWIMGNKDLAAMASGQMDKEGEGQTKAGKICGIIGTILLILGIIWGILVGIGIAGAASSPEFQEAMKEMQEIQQSQPAQ
ncbi:DUF4190 domain-containing protein [Verrucomicrobiales bacterium]|nr:DUF4190 domain-containing protein [Verrucomicrobiales bacterium]MDC0258610.1 DUF4190 domain-containing protein [Verrucomicrobiales bacterium]MDC0322738.1 DUF4190 domain-containing protein [Verrucomicrobiales bacterium]